jgi:superoxide reductase
MKNVQINRRAFLEASAMGAATVAAGGLFNVFGGEKKKATGIFVCQVCGHIEFGMAPEACPVCHAAKDQFTRNDAVFKDAAAKSAELPEKHIPEFSMIQESKVISEKPMKDIMVKIGKSLHPMEAGHYIQWIDCYVDGRYMSRLSLVPGTNPPVAGYPAIAGSKIRIVEHCNLHGHWQAERSLS